MEMRLGDDHDVEELNLLWILEQTAEALDRVSGQRKRSMDGGRMVLTSSINTEIEGPGTFASDV
jgi:hypothetical protein